MRLTLKVGLSLFFLVLMLVVLVFVGWRLATSTLPQTFVLPSILVLMIVGAWLVLAFISIIFKLLDLQNSALAFGLPDGSIRAVLAMSLIVLFAVVPLFLYTHMGESQHADNLTTTEKDSLVTSRPAGSCVVIQTAGPVAPASGTTGTTGTTTPGGAGAKNLPIKTTTDDSLRWTVYFPASNSTADDYAKQILTLLGTLVTSVVSFFFGAAVANSASASTAAALSQNQPPNPQGIRPNPIPPATDTVFTITGLNMNSIGSVTFVQQTQRISATLVGSNQTEVHGHVTLPVAGAWDVEMATNDNRTLKLANGVNAAVPPAPVVPNQNGGAANNGA